MSGHYKTTKLVASVPNFAKHTDPNLCRPGGLVLDSSRTIWVANSGNETIEKNISHYNQSGHHLGKKLLFVDWDIPFKYPLSPQRILISDLYWLKKNVIAHNDHIVTSIPIMHEQQILSNISEIKSFYNQPNGYFGSLVDISQLIDYCNRNAQQLLQPEYQEFNRTILCAHDQILPQLLNDLNNQTVIKMYSDLLLKAQQLPPVTQNTSSYQLISIGPVCDPSPVKFNYLPIGLTNNSSTGFHVPSRKQPVVYGDYHFASSQLIAATPEGKIYGYNPLIKNGSVANMNLMIDNSDSHSVYTGIVQVNEAIYATNVSNLRIDVYNYQWNIQTYAEGQNEPIDSVSFIDDHLPVNYSPFNIVADQTYTYVMYAKVDPINLLVNTKIIFGHGLGLINVFTLGGVFVKRAITYDHLNAPWGLVILQDNDKSKKFVVSNHGNGHIHIYDTDWKHLCTLRFNDNIYGLINFKDKYLYFVSGNKKVQGLLVKCSNKHSMYKKTIHNRCTKPGLNSKFRCYKAKGLVSNMPTLTKHINQNLCEIGNILANSKHEIWVVSHNNEINERCLSKYDSRGRVLIERISMIVYTGGFTPDSVQRQLINDLVDLRINVTREKTGVILSRPTIYPSAPIVNAQTETDLNVFYNAPNGYLGTLVDISYLINYCINHPDDNHAQDEFGDILRDAHQIYIRLLVNLSSKDLIMTYGNLLMDAQALIPYFLPANQIDLFLINKELKYTKPISVNTNTNHLPYGIIDNRSKGFPLGGWGVSTEIIIVTSLGEILGYNHLVKTAALGTPQSDVVERIIIDDSKTVGYTGAAQMNDKLFLVDFIGMHIVVFNFDWTYDRELTDTGFIDPQLPSNYKPFNIVVDMCQGLLYIMYVKLDATTKSEDHKILLGHGLGLINVFTIDGVFVKRAVTYGHLNAPWGLVILQDDNTSGKFLVTNYGNGRTHIYDVNWKHTGKLHISDHDNLLNNFYGFTLFDDEFYFVSSPMKQAGLLGKLKRK